MRGGLDRLLSRRGLVSTISSSENISLEVGFREQNSASSFARPDVDSVCRSVSQLDPPIYFTSSSRQEFRSCISLPTCAP